MLGSNDIRAAISSVPSRRPSNTSTVIFCWLLVPSASSPILSCVECRCYPLPRRFRWNSEENWTLYLDPFNGLAEVPAPHSQKHICMVAHMCMVHSKILHVNSWWPTMWYACHCLPSYLTAFYYPCYSQILKPPVTKKWVADDFMLAYIMKNLHISSQILKPHLTHVYYDGVHCMRN